MNIFCFVQNFLFRWVDKSECVLDISSKVINNLNAAENGEAGEEPHGASYEPQGCLYCDCNILQDIVIGCRSKVNLD